MVAGRGCADPAVFGHCAACVPTFAGARTGRIHPENCMHCGRNKPLGPPVNAPDKRGRGRRNWRAIGGDRWRNSTPPDMRNATWTDE